jgi:hypothetical protein
LGHYAFAPALEKRFDRSRRVVERGFKADDWLVARSRQETTMAFLEIPQWLIIGGAFLIMAGFVGLALSRNKEVKSDPASLPGDEPKPKPKSE